MKNISTQRGPLQKTAKNNFKDRRASLRELRKSIARNKYLYLLFFPVFAHYLIFKYWPMYGVIIAFKRYNIYEGISASPWVGFRYFQQFFESIYFWRLIRNTLALNFLDLLFGFPIPIIFALLLNEVSNKTFKRTVQTVSYLPHFISTVVVVSMLVNFLHPATGLINNIRAYLGLERVNFLADAKYFWGIYTMMNIWKGFGWGSIIYLAALSGIDVELYEAAIIDGAGRWRQTWHITLPGIMPVAIIMFLLRIGNILDVGYESIILMYNPKIYETADVLSTYVYRRGIQGAEFSFATAVGLFKSVIGLIMVVSANKISKKFTETSFW